MLILPYFPQDCEAVNLEGKHVALLPSSARVLLSSVCTAMGGPACVTSLPQPEPPACSLKATPPPRTLWGHGSDRAVEIAYIIRFLEASTL